MNSDVTEFITVTVSYIKLKMLDKLHFSLDEVVGASIWTLMVTNNELWHRKIIRKLTIKSEHQSDIRVSYPCTQ